MKRLLTLRNKRFVSFFVDIWCRFNGWLLTFLFVGDGIVFFCYNLTKRLLTLRNKRFVSFFVDIRRGFNGWLLTFLFVGDGIVFYFFLI